VLKGVVQRVVLKHARERSSQSPTVAGLSNSRGADRRERAIVDVEALAGIEQVDPVQGQRVRGGHDSHRAEGGDQFGAEGCFEQVERAPA